MTTTTIHKKDVQRAPDTWENLLSGVYDLRPIHTKSVYETAVGIAGELAAAEKLTKDQQDYLESLSCLIEDYEQRKFAAGKTEPLAILRFLVEENEMSASDLGRLLGDRSLGSRVLSGQRGLSKSHIAILSERFSVSPALFF